jgi:hypothetical protein
VKSVLAELGCGFQLVSWGVAFFTLHWHGRDGTNCDTLCVQRAGDQQQQVWFATTGQHSNDVRWSSCFAMGEPVVRNPFTLNEEAAQAVLKLQRSIFAFALSEIEWTHTHDAKVSVSALSCSLDTPSRWPSRTCVRTRAHARTHAHTHTYTHTHTHTHNHTHTHTHTHTHISSISITSHFTLCAVPLSSSLCIATLYGWGRCAVFVCAVSRSALELKICSLRSMSSRLTFCPPHYRALQQLCTARVRRCAPGRVHSCCGRRSPRLVHPVGWVVRGQEPHQGTRRCVSVGLRVASSLATRVNAAPSSHRRRVCAPGVQPPSRCCRSASATRVCRVNRQVKVWATCTTPAVSGIGRRHVCGERRAETIVEWRWRAVGA